MRYLFFDIECSDGRHICSFGYVVTDTRFNVLEKKDLVINPEYRFQLGRYSGGEELQLAYPRAVFRAAPPFTQFYEQIAQLINEQDQIIFGHAVDNDANFLNIACSRYNLPQLNYKYVDSQVLYKTYSGVKQQASLEKIMSELGIVISDYHKSCDDAEMSMLTLKEICKRTDSTVDEFLELCPNAVGETRDGQLIKKACGGNRKNYNVYFCRVSGLRAEKRIDNPLIRGKRFCLSNKLEKGSTLKIWTIVQMILDCGGKYTKRTSKCDFFVRHSDKDCGRLRNIEERIKKDDRCTIVTLDDLLAMLNTTYSAIEPFDIESYLKVHPMQDKTEIKYVDDGKKATLATTVEKRERTRRGD